jgi:hypothetical protein
MEKAVKAIIKARTRRAELAPHSSPAPSPERVRAPTLTAATADADAAKPEPLRVFRPGTARVRAVSRGKPRRASSASRRRPAIAAVEDPEFNTVAILAALAAGRQRRGADVGLPFDVTPGHIVVVDDELRVVNGVRSQPHSVCPVAVAFDVDERGGRATCHAHRPKEPRPFQAARFEPAPWQQQQQPWPPSLSKPRPHLDTMSVTTEDDSLPAEEAARGAQTLLRRHAQRVWSAGEDGGGDSGARWRGTLPGSRVRVGFAATAQHTGALFKASGGVAAPQQAFVMCYEHREFNHR